MKFLLFLLVPAVAFSSTPYECQSELELLSIIRKVKDGERSGFRQAAQFAIESMAYSPTAQVMASDMWVNTIRFLITTVPLSRGLDPMDPDHVLRAYLRYFTYIEGTEQYKPAVPCQALKDGMYYFQRHTSYSEAIKVLDGFNLAWKCENGHSMASNVGKAVEQNAAYLRSWDPYSAKADWKADNKWHKTRNYGKPKE